MFRIYLLAALFLLAFGMMLYRTWRADRDMAALFKGIGLIALGFLFLAFTRSMLAYEPLMVLHIAALLLYWYAVARYLLQRYILFWLLSAPAVTTALFFFVAWYFKEV